jgi:hypothetical protein
VSTDRIFDEESRAGRRGELRGAHRHIKPNRKPKRPRKKDWWDAVDDEFGPRTQRVMRRGEQERRAMVEAQASATLESVDEDAVQTTWEDEAAAGEMGLVLEVSSSVYRVAVDARVLLCSLRGSLTVEETGFTNRVAAGDRVRVTTPGGNRGVIEAILPRRSALARPDPFHPHRKQVIVANADQLLIVVSWLEPPAVARTDRPVPDRRRAQPARPYTLCQQDRSGGEPQRGAGVGCPLPRAELPRAARQRGHR